MGYSLWLKRIHEKLNSLNIDNELYSEPGEPHEYWGTTAGDWPSGSNPNDFYFWNDILYKGFRFLYRQLHPGDVNLNGVLNIQDILLTINQILGDSLPEEQEYLADINHDGSINISDIVLMVSKIIN